MADRPFKKPRVCSDTDPQARTEFTAPLKVGRSDESSDAFDARMEKWQHDAEISVARVVRKALANPTYSYKVLYAELEKLWQDDKPKVDEIARLEQDATSRESELLHIGNKHKEELQVDQDDHRLSNEHVSKLEQQIEGLKKEVHALRDANGSLRSAMEETISLKQQLCHANAELDSLRSMETASTEVIQPEQLLDCVDTELQGFRGDNTLYPAMIETTQLERQAVCLTAELGKTQSDKTQDFALEEPAQLKRRAQTMEEEASRNCDEQLRREPAAEEAASDDARSEMHQ